MSDAELGPATGDYVFNPENVNLTSADLRDIICYLNAGENDYDGRIGLRVAALFVILITSTAATFFPVVARRVRWVKIPVYVYLFARYFGAGVIVATAFIHLLQPAYDAIGPATCVGMTGGWAEYSWPPAICLMSVMIIFLFDLVAERWAEKKYGGTSEELNVEAVVTQNHNSQVTSMGAFTSLPKDEAKYANDGDDDEDSIYNRHAYYSQFAGFLILEFGVMFHSVIIGLNLGVAGEEFNALFPVLVFHQTFEGLGIGARMSAIPFPKNSYLPWILCLAYGLTTPVAIAIGLGVRTTYNPGSYTANVVSGLLDSLSAGILIYTGLVELLARDFLFDPKRTRETKRLTFMVVCVMLGAGLMALLGKWA